MGIRTFCIYVKMQETLDLICDVNGNPETKVRKTIDFHSINTSCRLGLILQQ